MQSIKLFAILISLLLVSLVQGQNGFIRGTVFDDGLGESLPGVTIFLEGTTMGTLTDLDGKFSLEVPPGDYTLRVSYISYETMLIKDLEVKSGEVTLLDNLRLKESSIELNEVTITAKVVRNTETALLMMKMKSANVIDGISAANFRKIGDSDAASSMKRVPGLSVEGGKYVYVRGLGDRYTKTMLNGMDIPGLDPDRNTLQMDIFPTNIIDNIIVYKSFTADLPADFTGGVIDITVKDLPEEKQGGISISAGYNPGSHFNKNYLTYKGGNTDFLGFDDGTRKIPATSNIPFYADVVTDPYGAQGMRYQEILESFNPTMAAHTQTSFMDYSMGFSIGDQIPGKKVTFGYNVAISYKNNTDFYKNAEYGHYGLSSDPNVTEMELREFQKGNLGENNVLLGGLAGFAIKTKKSKYRLNLLHLQNGESSAGIFDYIGADQGSNFSGFQHNLGYSERAMTNIFIDGKHLFGDDNWEIVWKLSPTRSTMNDPDIRFTRYITDGGAYIIGTESGFPERIWRSLKEVNIPATIDVTKTFKMKNQKSILKFGGAFTYKERDFAIRSFAFNIRNVTLTGNPDELFYPENLWPIDSNVNRGTTYDASFIPVNPNQFNSNVNNAAGYLSFEINVFKHLKTILGVRFENYVQRYTGQDQLGIHKLDNEKVLEDNNFFPSVNLIYSLTEKQNLRLSYAMTIARPSFKELSYAEIFDPISGRTFIGGLFRDANDAAGIVYWDGNLKSTNIHNFDLRWEWFPRSRQTISVSGFYKRFISPIEIVQYATLQGAFQPRNVGDGQVFGGELELRLNLDLIAKALEKFQFTANFTYVKSRIKLSTTEYESRLANARTGQSISEYRAMAGQAPYVINCGLSYNGGKNGFWNEFEAGLYYNVQGLTLEYVGMVDRPDIYTKPFNSLNFNANKNFGKKKRVQVGLKVENILNAKKESVYKSYEAADQYFLRLNPGMTFKVSVKYSLF
ncbi:MAG: TonB-dependent receptor [Bacteroidales bacterium]|nr:TonB-dependent receptor [Bacteroidales bacterium]